MMVRASPSSKKMQMGPFSKKSVALIVEAMIGNYTVYRVLIDNGSSVEILYSDYLEKMGIDKSQLSTTSQPLYGFTTIALSQREQ